ncbi:uncharacterized protein BDR25DRAFT_97245 [Lindgomyces ingoldianus]|uniref:Uncharacterized protein n=1 Tax=Lindgomyces ingoldianus TaxID=673940 RepID=A0ACB6QBA1_9PLEO|nr:uncharacterized protein BDR25DRAFT_97245 [Lindgomyces ingoldianus]KAF2464214.1 hypothetical protein BDR25DRAFT_97245 [Lindgomyces ingoldianus]
MHLFNVFMAIGAFAGPSLAAANTTHCFSNDTNPDGTLVFAPYNTVYFINGYNILRDPCEGIRIDIDGECIPLEPGCLASLAPKVFLPVASTTATRWTIISATIMAHHFRPTTPEGLGHFDAQIFGPISIEHKWWSKIQTRLRID